ncbi:hypothetical protein RBWH47_02604 [Rhodopirellula baltica WH47]|uniref:Uncharacterized protein n=1 Tax=Rhodopirellula baltica WH47 TaxID=991778 RepID=F2AZM3_RHOBT|nr:hypothetical protein RBWH47_02604 [Rhodopirellula baltica WH47]
MRSATRRTHFFWFQVTQLTLSNAFAEDQIGLWLLASRTDP